MNLAGIIKCVIGHYHWNEDLAGIEKLSQTLRDSLKETEGIATAMRANGVIRELNDRGDEATLASVVRQLEKTMQCVCDLDNWEPERDTGHSWVCPIHKAAKAKVLSVWSDIHQRFFAGDLNAQLSRKRRG